jgi:hypothetical protein
MLHDIHIRVKSGSGAKGQGSGRRSATPTVRAVALLPLRPPREGIPPSTANCTIIGQFSAFELELVALFSRCRLKTAGNGSKRPEI